MHELFNINQCVSNRQLQNVSHTETITHSAPIFGDSLARTFSHCLAALQSKSTSLSEFGKLFQLIEKISLIVAHVKYRNENSDSDSNGGGTHKRGKRPKKSHDGRRKYCGNMLPLLNHSN